MADLVGRDVHPGAAVVPVPVVSGPVGRIENAVPGARVTVVRLGARLEVIHARIRSRDHSQPDWYLNAATHLSRSMDEQPIEDHLIDNTTLSIKAIPASLRDPIDAAQSAPTP